MSGCLNIWWNHFLRDISLSKTSSRRLVYSRKCSIKKPPFWDLRGHFLSIEIVITKSIYFVTEPIFWHSSLTWTLKYNLIWSDSPTVFREIKNIVPVYFSTGKFKPRVSDSGCKYQTKTFFRIFDEWGYLTTLHFHNFKNGSKIGLEPF